MGHMVLWYHIRSACGRPWAQIPVCPLAQLCLSCGCGNVLRAKAMSSKCAHMQNHFWKQAAVLGAHSLVASRPPRVREVLGSNPTRRCH